MKLAILLSLCACAGLVANEVADEATQLKGELSALKVEAQARVLQDADYSESLRNQVSDSISDLQVDELEKLANDPNVSDQRKAKTIKKLRKQLKRAESVLHK